MKKTIFWPFEFTQEGILPAPEGCQLLNWRGFWDKKEYPEDAEPGDYWISTIDAEHYKNGWFIIRGNNDWGCFYWKGQKGDKGDKGEKGDPGKQGERGLKGDQGPKGDKGQKGDQGPKGDKGTDGKDGKDGKIQELTSKDNSVDINNSDPNKPDLSIKKFLGFTLPNKITEADNGKVLVPDFKNKKWVFVEKGGSGGNSFGTILINGASPLKAKKPNDVLALDSQEPIILEPDTDKNEVKIKQRS